MAQFWRVVNDVIWSADVLLLLLDARMVGSTRNIEIENKVRNMGKPLIYVISKCDLVSQGEAERWKKALNPAVFVSATEYHGINMLKERIMIEAKRAGIKEQIFVGVLGYPNVGKSSLINAMVGRKAAAVSILSGHTKHLQKIKASQSIVFLDTPGVIPYNEKDEIKHAFIGTIDFTKAKEPDLVVMELMEEFPGRIEEYFKVEAKDDKEDVINDIAVKKKILKKKGLPDIERTARMILKDWQKGVIKNK